MLSIKEIAKKANVSPATVSRVLNNTANVTDEKRKRVLAVVKEMGVQTTKETKGLLKKSTKIIGVVIENTENTFVKNMVTAITMAAFQKGYQVLLSGFGENVEKELSSFQTLSRIKTDGIIILSGNKKVQKALEKCQVPIVTFDHAVSDMIEGANVIANIESNHSAAGKLAMKHLIECGCKNIVFLRDSKEDLVSKKRSLGYKEICQKYGIKEAYVSGGTTYEDGEKTIKEIFRQYPHTDGIIAPNEMITYSIVNHLRKKRYRVPEDVQVIGFDGSRLKKYQTTEISTVSQAIQEMGTLAVQIILDYFYELSFQKENIFDVSLMERRTTKRKERRYEKTRDFE